MILITKDSENNCIFTLSENTTITGDTAVQYLFKVVSDDDSDDITYFTGTDISPNKVRYNQFTIIETGSTYVNLTASTIDLQTPGFYSYEVYQCNTGVTASIYNAVGGAIEFGQLFFSADTTSQITNTYTGSTDFYVYNG